MCFAVELPSCNRLWSQLELEFCQHPGLWLRNIFCSPATVPTPCRLQQKSLACLAVKHSSNSVIFVWYSPTKLLFRTNSCKSSRSSFMKAACQRSWFVKSGNQSDWLRFNNLGSHWSVTNLKFLCLEPNLRAVKLSLALLYWGNKIKFTGLSWGDYRGLISQWTHGFAFYFLIL